MNRTQFARALGIHPSLVTRIENGKRRVTEKMVVEMVNLFVERFGGREDE